VTLLHPWALLGLLLIPLLLWLERRRRRPRPVVWPSLLLWRALGETVRERQRRIEPLLLLECAAVLLLTLAAAGPQFRTGVAGRLVVVHLETGPRTQARRQDGRTVLEATRVELDRIRAALAPEDEWVVHEVERAIAPHATGDIRILATNRPDIEAKGAIVVGRAPAFGNVGFTAVRVVGDRLGFSVWSETAATVVVDLGQTLSEVDPGHWNDIEFVPGLRIVTPNNYDGDDHVALRRVRLKVRTDSESPLVEAALRVGVPAEPGEPADLVLETQGGTRIPERVRGSDGVAAAGLFEGLFLDECIWEGARGREDAGREEPGLLAWRKRSLARWTDERTLWLGLPVDRAWDEYGTLALVLERAKRHRARALLGEGEALVGDAIARPAPRFVETHGVDRPWDGKLPDVEPRGSGVFNLRALLATLALVTLLAYGMLLGRKA